MISDFPKLKDKVLFCLNKYPSTRNSDIYLIQKIFEDFYNISITDPWFMVINAIRTDKAPCFEIIRRCRQVIQRSGLFKSTDKTRTQRKKLESNVKSQILNWE